MKKLILFLCALAATLAVAEPVDNLKKLLNNSNSLKANFKQVVKEGNKLIQTSAGNLYLLRPGKFRWFATKPMKQLIVSDGKSLWIYDEDLEQVTIKQLSEQVRGTPARFLSGYDDQITKDYDVYEEQIKGMVVFKFMSKNKDKSAYLTMKLSYRNNKLSSIFLEDKLGQTTLVRLYNVSTNAKIPDSLFNFKPPKGVDIIKQ